MRSHESPLANEPRSRFIAGGASGANQKAPTGGYRNSRGDFWRSRPTRAFVATHLSAPHAHRPQTGRVASVATVRPPSSSEGARLSLGCAGLTHELDAEQPNKSGPTSASCWALDSRSPASEASRVARPLRPLARRAAGALTPTRANRFESARRGDSRLRTTRADRTQSYEATPKSALAA